MKKFDEWNVLKKQLNNLISNTKAKERELWWCHVGINIGSEEDGKIDSESFGLLKQKVAAVLLNCETPLTRGFSEPLGTVDTV